MEGEGGGCGRGVKKVRGSGGLSEKKQERFKGRCGEMGMEKGKGGEVEGGLGTRGKEGEEKSRKCVCI